MSYRVQWRNRTPSGNPSKVEWEDGHDAAGAIWKARNLMTNPERVCWVWIEDLDSSHKGNSLSKPKLRAKTSRT